MDRIFNEDEPVKKCPTCGSEITGISEVFDATGKKISTNYSYGEDSPVNEKEHKILDAITNGGIVEIFKE